MKKKVHRRKLNAQKLKLRQNKSESKIALKWDFIELLKIILELSNQVIGCLRFVYNRFEYNQIMYYARSVLMQIECMNFFRDISILSDIDWIRSVLTVLLKTSALTHFDEMGRWPK